MKKTKVITLFSGVGMQELGFDTAGLEYELINYCEFEKKPSKGFSLIHDCSEDLNIGDITKVDEKKYFQQLKDDGNGDIDIIISSFPCQAFSAAGLRKGFEDPTRGTLFYDTMRIANEVKPSILIFENVKGLTNHDQGNTLRQIEKKVFDSGYKMFYQILNSINFDIPQNRERWFAVCIRNDLYNKKFYFPVGEKTNKCVAEFLETDITNRKKSSKMSPILNDLRNGKKQIVNYRSEVGLKKVYDGIKQGDFKSGFTRTGIFSIYGSSSTLLKSNENHFLEIDGKLTPKERMRLMGVDDKYTDRLIESNFSELEIDAIAGNGLVVNVFEKLITEVYKYMGWIEGENKQTETINIKKKRNKNLVENNEPICELDYIKDINDKKKNKNNFMITKQQFLVLYDIAKAAMNINEGFAGYSNTEIMKLLNQIISQQDNTVLNEFIDDEKSIDRKYNDTVKIDNVVEIDKVVDIEENKKTEILDNIVNIDNVNINDENDESFWDF